MGREVWRGRAYPLGASCDEEGTNFSIYSEVADAVELCLFEDGGSEERIPLVERDAYCWHGYLPGVGSGQRYGYRVHGPWRPEEGVRCNPVKLLLDPYARAIEGQVDWDEACFQHRFHDVESRNDLDSAPHVPRSVVVDSAFDWGDDRRPHTPMRETVLYEAHVKGLTMRHPDVPEALRGTYAGVAHPSVIEHLKELGITALELLPVHHFIHDAFLADKGLSNYSGYNSIGFFAPHNGYAAAHPHGEQVREFKGIDNPAYYRLVPDDPRFYYDTTGTGNSLNARHPHSLQRPGRVPQRHRHHGPGQARSAREGRLLPRPWIPAPAMSKGPKRRPTGTRVAGSGGTPWRWRLDRSWCCAGFEPAMNKRGRSQ